MASQGPALKPIPVVDARDGGMIGYATEGRERARVLRDECLTFLPGPVRGFMPGMLDAVTRVWLRRSASPYVKEIETIASAVGATGVWLLNGSYIWGCTTNARDEIGVPWLARTLDWPFVGLGRRIEVARMRGAAGVFDNVTWPGYVGCLTASAPDRFAATLNQAPMRRRTRDPRLRPYDFTLNALHTWGLRFMPPDHLLRQVFETCRHYGEARRMLETTPVARPVIYTLVGCRRGERCVIERTQEAFRSRDSDTGASNDWLVGLPGWEARIRPDMIFTRTYEEAAANSQNRRLHLAAWTGQVAGGGFGWVTPPVLNPFTRVAVEMCPATGVLRVVGYERPVGGELAEPVTLPCEVTAPAYA